MLWFQQFSKYVISSHTKQWFVWGVLKKGRKGLIRFIRKLWDYGDITAIFGVVSRRQLYMITGETQTRHLSLLQVL